MTALSADPIGRSDSINDLMRCCPDVSQLSSLLSASADFIQQPFPIEASACRGIGFLIQRPENGPLLHAFASNVGNMLRTCESDPSLLTAFLQQHPAAAHALATWSVREAHTMPSPVVVAKRIDSQVFVDLLQYPTDDYLMTLRTFLQEVPDTDDRLARVLPV